MKAALIFLVCLATVTTCVHSFVVDGGCKGVIFNCFVQPCRFAKCPSHSHAVCRDNYCDGCNADFYVGNHKVDCTTASVVDATTATP